MRLFGQVLDGGVGGLLFLRVHAWLTDAVGYMYEFVSEVRAVVLKVGGAGGWDGKVVDGFVFCGGVV